MNRDVANQVFIGPRFMRELFPRAKKHAKTLAKQRRRANEPRIIAEQLNEELDEFMTIDQVNELYILKERERDIREYWEPSFGCSCC